MAGSSNRATRSKHQNHVVGGAAASISISSAAEMVRTTSATRLVHLGQGRTATSVNNFVVSQASSANGCKRNTTTSLGPFIPIQAQTGSEESMSLIVQLGTTVVATTTQQQASVSKSPLSLGGSYTTARVVNSAYRDLNQRASATNKCNVQQLPEPQHLTKMKLIDVQNAVALEKQKLEQIEIKKEEPEEKKHLPYYGIPFEAQTEEQRMEIVKFVLQDHNYGAPPPASPPLSPPHHGKTVPSSMNPLCTNTFGSTGASYAYGSGLLALRDAANNDDDDANSVISSNPGREVEPEGEETETAPEGEGDDEDSVTRCICEFEHDDGYMICCDKCFVWQHVDCMGIDRLNIPDEYMCERCQPRRVDRQRARTLQLRKREELLNTDTCSDTSSTTSTDTESVVVNAGSSATKRRAASSVNRRKSDQARPVSKKNVANSSGSNSNTNNNNNNNNGSNNSSNNLSASNHNNNNSVSTSVTKQRQRRDSVKEHIPATPTTQRRSSANQNKKKEPVKPIVENKKPSTRRKSKRCLSEEEGQDVWDKPSSGAMQQLRQWIDNYEEAVTNHYSPELRARISSIKVNGIHSDLKTGNLLNTGSGATKCRVSQAAPGVRILVSTTTLLPHQPVIELRGKYMLSTQHRPAALNSVNNKRSRPPPGPFIFFYRLPKDGTEVCVDTRTYGNDARFIRRSCKPNAEVRHCIEKGILHLYIVTMIAIEKNCEITISHDGTQDTAILANSGGSGQAVCACGNPKECTAFIKGNGALEVSDRERRRRGRRAFSSEERDGLSGSNQAQKNILQASETNSISVDTLPPTRRNSSSTRSPTKHQQQPSPVLPPPPPPPPPQQEEMMHQEEENNESGDQKQEISSEQQEKKRKLTREERKMEAIMKAFERLEKAEQRRQENQAKQAHRKEETHMPPEGKRNTHTEEKEEVPKQRSTKSSAQERPRRKRRKGRGRASNNNSSGNGNSASLRRRTRLNSGDSDMTSADEAVPIVTSHSEAMSTSTNAGCSQQGSPVSAAAGLLLALANGSNVSQPSSVSPYHPQTPPHTDNIPRSTTPQGQVFCESSGSGSSQSSTPSTPLSSACLLVAAAVGPLAPGFKFPKTKKVLMNEWLNKSPETISVPPPLSSPILARPGDLPLSTDLMLNPAVADSYGFSSQHSPSKSLATLAQAANRVALGTSTSPVPNFCRATSGTKGNAQSPGGRVGSAKKRWLRQAISEECDSPTPNSCASPNSRGGSPPPCPDYVTPLKKRRVARESMSSEQSFTPPTTPTMLADQHLVSVSPTSQKCGQYDGASMNLVVEEDDTITSPGEEDNAGLNEYEEPEEKCESNFDERCSPVDADVRCSGTGDCHQGVLRNGGGMRPEGCENSVEMDSGANEKIHIQESEVEEEEDDEEEEEEEETALHSPTLDQPQDMLDDKATELKTEVVHSSEETEEEGCRGFEDQDADSRHYDTMNEADSEGEKQVAQEVDKAAETKEDGQDPDQKVEAESTQTTSTSSATAQPAKRKVRPLSISEYRQRKQRNSEAESMPRSNENEETIAGSPAHRSRTNSTSSSSSLSSDDDIPSVNKSLLMDASPALSTLPLFLQSDGVDDKKGGGEELNYMRWNSAPTLVERQRENLTERLRREFGLFLSDDEEQERVRKQGLAQETVKDGKKKAPPPPPPPPLPPPEVSTATASQHLIGMYSSPQKLAYSSVLVPNNVSVNYVSPGSSAGYASAGSSRQVQGYGPYPVKTQTYAASYPAGLGGKGMQSAAGKGPATATAAIYQTPTTNVGNVKTAQKYLLTTPPPPPPPLPTPSGSQYVVQAPYGASSATQQVMLVSSSRVTSQTPSHFVASAASGNTAASGSATTFYTAAAAKAYYPPPPLPTLPPPPPPPRT